MKFQHTALLSLGSNLGNRAHNLQQAIDFIHTNVATVIKASGVYQTPAQGFDGAAFYNCVLLVHTTKTPQQLLEGLQQAEQHGGRVRSSDGNYISRTIDADIIAYDDAVIASETLQVPHPRMQGRDFVLYPLNDVAPQWQHPVLKKNAAQLIDEINGNTDCELVLQLPQPLAGSNPEQCKYIAIEGNIGVGKTSLALKISEDFKARLVLERFADNPFLPKFYNDAPRYAFPLETSFLADRYQQLTEDLAQFNLQDDFVVADYHIVKSLIFAKVTLTEDEYNLYRRLFDIMYKDVPRPGLYVYLSQDSATLLQHIKQRGRDYEQDIKAAYLDDISNGYLEYIKAETGLNVVVINVTGRDFVNHQPDYIWLLQQLQAAAV